MSFSPNFRGSQGAAAKQIQSNFTNASGGFLPMGSVVSSNANGQIEMTNVSDDTSVSRFIGITGVGMPDAATGAVVSQGRIEALTTTFAVGDAVYVNTDGTLTNVKPDYGVGSFVAGNYVIFIGVIIKNEFNPALKDLQINPTVVGQL